MRERLTAIALAIAMLSTGFIVLVGSPAAAADVNQPPSAQHSDRVEEDEDGDGEETVRFQDRQSQDPDHIHKEGDNLLCQLNSETTDGNNGIESWTWYNSTDLNRSEFQDQRNDRFLDRGETTGGHTFGIGTWRIALQVQDTCGASGWTNFTLEIRPETITLYDFDGETGLGSEWSTSGLWRVADECDVEASGNYLAYNEYGPDGNLDTESDCDYDNGEPNEGTAKVVSIDPSHSRESGEKSWYRIGIQFDHFHEVGTDSLADQDRMLFQASFNGGETWVGATNFTEDGCGASQNDEGKNCWDDDSNDTDEWVPQANVFDLRNQDYTGGDILFRWMFNTTNTNDNDNLGWLIDDVFVWGLEENTPPQGGDLDLYGCDVYLEDDAPDAPENHRFDCHAHVSGASDPDGAIDRHEYRWGDGTTTSVDDPSSGTEHQYPIEDGTYQPDMKVFDDGMATATSTTEKVKFLYWDTESDEWDDDGLWDVEDEGTDDCGIDALTGDEWMGMTNNCDYSSLEKSSDHLKMYGDLDLSSFKNDGDGDRGDWEFEFTTQHRLGCGDHVDLEIRLDGNPDWNTTDERLDCDNEPYNLDDDWDTFLNLQDSKADDFETLNDQGNWVDTSRFPSDLEVRLAGSGDTGGEAGAFVDDIAFFASTD